MLTEAMHAGAFIVSEEENFHCRDAITIALSQTILCGQVLGRRNIGTAAVTSAVVADASNTGNGVFTLDATAPVGAGAINGDYRVVNELVAANSGEFVVYNPRGVEIGRVAVGATFNSDIKFVIADGATDFAIGDAFTVSVGIETEGDLEYLPLNLAGTDGTQNAVAIAIYPVTTDGVTKQKIAGLVRGPAQVRAADLTWPAGITAVQKAKAVEQLNALNIVSR